MMESNIQTRTIDEALKLVGSFGRFHIGLLFINIVFQFFVPWMTQVITFTGATSDHYCKPQDGFNKSDSIPLVEGIHYTEDVYSSCDRYVDPYYKNDTEGCLDGWVYSDDVYGETLVTEWDLVCSKEGLADISQSLMMLGGAIGSVVAGTLAGHFGRRPIIIGTLLIYVICGCGLIFSPNLAVFTVLFTLYGAAEPGFWSNCHILLMEYLLPDRRALISSWPPLFQSFGAVFLSFLAFYIRDWRYLQAVLMIPPVLMLSIIWLIPESVRWHVSRNDLVKAENLLKRIASINKKDSSCQFLIQTSLDREAVTSTADHSYSNAAFSLDEKDSELPTVSAEVSKKNHEEPDEKQNHFSLDKKDSELPTVSAEVSKKNHEEPDEKQKHFSLDKKDSELPTVSAEVSKKNHEQPDEKRKPTFLDILRPPVLFVTVSVCFIRTTYSLVYFGFVLNTGNLAGDPYLNFLIGALLEIPARLFPIALVKRLGGKSISTIFFLLSGLTLTVIVFLPQETKDGKNLGGVITGVSLLGRFLITCSNAALILLPMELFPTTVRTLGTGVAQFFGRFGGFLAPLLLYLDNLLPNLSILTMAITSITAALLSYLLPETFNEPQPETPDDLRNLMKKKRGIFPASRPNHESDDDGQSTKL